MASAREFDRSKNTAQPNPTCKEYNRLTYQIQHQTRPENISFNQRTFHSHFTTREHPDAVRYHPLYQGFRPLGDGSTNDLVDLTMNNPMFWPPEGQE